MGNNQSKPMTQDDFINEEIEECKQTNAKIKKLIQIKSNTVGEYKVEIALKTGLNNPYFSSHDMLRERLRQKVKDRKNKISTNIVE
jgi:hypothetical protein